MLTNQILSDKHEGFQQYEAICFLNSVWNVCLYKQHIRHHYQLVIGDWNQNNIDYWDMLSDSIML